jgi:putative spermidine/putrescine transport system substrate-binding protein
MKSIMTMAVISAALMASPVTGSAQQSLVVASWGGAYVTAQTESMYKPFEARNNVRIVPTNRSVGLAEVAAQVRTGNVKWDVIDVGPWEAIKGCDEGLFENIDATKLPAGADGAIATKDFGPGMLQKCAVSVSMYANVIAYDRVRLGTNGPKNLEDFFDTKKFPGKRGLFKTPVAILEWAVMADGVAPADVYRVLNTQEGVDRAFRKLDTIKKDIVWWSAGSQAVNLLATGEVVMSHVWHGRVVDANSRDRKDFAIVWDGSTMLQQMFAVVKGSKNSAAAHEFVRQSTSAAALADLTNYIPYAPTRRSSMAMIPDANPYKVWLPSGPRSMLINAEFWAEHEDDLAKRFNNWLAR